MGSTMKPSMRALGAWTCTWSRMALAAAVTSASVRRLRRTPPTSDLWVMSGDRIFTAQGTATAATIFAASAASLATRVSTTGMP